MDNLKLLHAIFNTAIDGIITIDSQGLIETMNPAALRLFGYEEEEVSGENISVLIPKPDKGAHNGYLHRHQDTGKKRIIGTGREVLGLKKDGTTFPFRLAVSEVEYENRKIYTGFIHDLSKEKEAEENLKKYTSELEAKIKERTQNLEHLINDLEKARDEADRSMEKQKELNLLKTRFVSMASHEFRTPLSSIQLSALLIDKYLEKLEPENILKHTAKIKNSVAHLTGILNDFLSLEKLEAGKTKALLQSFDLVKFSEELIEEMQLIAKQNQNIVYQHTGAISHVYLDPALLKNAAINLVSNAIKYSGENTFIEFNSEVDEAEVCITVKDNGIGIPEEEQKHLFQPFFRAHNTGNIPGTGLGLNIVKRYVELMGGKVIYHSAQHEGTSVSLIFKNR
ncbi:PAS domain-containing sensor histidine kinase [Adhaeribacter arboris]|uniref:Sensor protein FixL n=1 Tax=Adhaeribacter arboris TaxID=2072846 RepID=A0A2T2YND5_9BACT|nr:PAS domain-containing sensor histidine kinase [Adhaeribacter arboris]PSR57006.1 PAS domain-containing sensor histidine kinase [Adhaeribacter arboris]